MIVEDRVTQDPLYRFVERTWRLQQLPFALALTFGEWAWVFSGISLCILVSLNGHWNIGHFAHSTGHQGWRIAGLPVQGR